MFEVEDMFEFGANVYECFGGNQNGSKSEK
jgi:hypothetical protein